MISAISPATKLDQYTKVNRFDDTTSQGISRTDEFTQYNLQTTSLGWSRCWRLFSFKILLMIYA